MPESSLSSLARQCSRCLHSLGQGEVPAICPSCGLPLEPVEASGAPAASGAIDDPRPLRTLLTIAAPSVATMTSYTAMQFVDALMVAEIAPDPVYVSAQGNGGMAAFVPISCVMGVLTIVNTFVSQNFGAGRPERGSGYAWNALWIAALAWLIQIPYALALPALFGAMGHEARLVDLETRYATILVLGAFTTMGARGLAQFFYGMHRPMTVLAAAIVGNLVNVGLNWVLIYGNLGAPAMGVSGAAIATVIGSAVELAIQLGVFLAPAFNSRYATRTAWRPTRAHVLDILRVGWPGGLMFVSEMVCWGYFTVRLAGSFGTLEQTAGWIALRYMHMSFMPAVGISIAVAAMVGKSMGMGRPDLAERRAWLGLRVTLAYMGFCAICFLFLRAPMIRLFIREDMPPDQAAELVRIGSRILIAAAVFQLFDATAITLSAALRGAGDTVWPGVLALVLSWTSIVAGGHAFVHWAPGLGSLGPWMAASGYIVLLGLALLWRFVRGPWRGMRLVEPGTPSA